MSPEPHSLSQQIAVNSQKLAALRADVSRLVDQIDRWNGKSSLPSPWLTPAPDADVAVALQEQSAQIAALINEIRQLEARLRGLEDLSLVAPRKPMHMRLIELVIGREYYRPWWRASDVPGITIVIPAGGDHPTAATVRSVLGQSRAGWDVIVVGAEPGNLLRQVIEASAGRARIVSAKGMIWDFLEKGLSEASAAGTGRVIGIVHPGQQFEPTAAESIIRFFGRHPRAMVAYFEKTARSGPWRMPLPRGPRMDVYALLAEGGDHGWGHGGVFFRRQALGMVGGYQPAMRGAAEWHLYLRLTRMFGLHRATGQVLCIPRAQMIEGQPGEQLEFERAREDFLDHFGLAGQIRCRAIRLLNSIRQWSEPGDEPMPALPAEAMEQDVESVAVECPLNGEKADRLLFTAPDRAGEPCYVFRCGDGVAAVVQKTTLSRASGAIPPLGDLSDVADGELPGALLRYFSVNDPTVRALLPKNSAHADALARQTKWDITRLPAGAQLADAAVLLPEAQRFDVVWAGAAIRCSADPAGVLRALQSVLAPGGIVAFSAPNLDSPRRRQLGPKWEGWTLAEYPMLIGRRGLLELARLADLRVLSWRSRGDDWLALLQMPVPEM